MNATTEKTLREIALESPSATRVFEKMGLDYCCGGGKSLGDACRAASISFEALSASLAEADRTAVAPAETADWQHAPLADLIAHIKDTHHRFTRSELARLSPLFDKVCSVHGKNHPELIEMRSALQGLTAELTSHLMKEEVMLFPYIVRLEEAVTAHEPVLPAPFGTVRNPIAMMMHEHDGAGDVLRIMRQASGGYVAPEGACVSFQTLYRALVDFEADLHRHIHLENNILFPRAIVMES